MIWENNIRRSASGFIIACLIMASCAGQENQKMANKPEIKINVNKITDKEGRIIRYDSTYSFSTANPVLADSVLNRFFKATPWQDADPFFPFNLSDWPKGLLREMKRQSEKTDKGALFYEKRIERNKTGQEKII